jgi:hypothetical protein
MEKTNKEKQEVNENLRYILKIKSVAKRNYNSG